MSRKIAIEKLSALVKSKRGTKGLRETAKEIGDVSPSTLSRIEQGKMPDLETFVKLCDWLGISTNEFIEGEEDGSANTSDVPIPEGASNLEIIEAHLRADRELNPDTAEALANMVRAAYNAVAKGTLGQKK